MKKCPKCGYIVTGDDYCRICNTCVLHEPYITSDEKPAGFNRYLLFFYVKRLIVPVVCFIVVVIFTLLIGDFGHPLVIAALLFSGATVIMGIFGEKIININAKYYTKDYARFRYRMVSIGFSVMSVVLILAIYFL